MMRGQLTREDVFERIAIFPSKVYTLTIKLLPLGYSHLPKRSSFQTLPLSLHTWGDTEYLSNWFEPFESTGDERSVTGSFVIYWVDQKPG